MKRLAQNLFLATGTVVVCLLLLEAGVRFIGAYDLDGNFIICGRTLKPYHLPIRTTRQKTAEYLHSKHTRVMADAQLGWTNRPGGRSANGLYAYNSQGARTSPATPVEYRLQPLPDTLRIVIVGDSYTHGDEVPIEHTWGYYQEKVWLKSRLVGLGLEMVSPTEVDPYFYDVDEEPARLSLAIIKMFQSQVAAAGSNL